MGEIKPDEQPLIGTEEVSEQLVLTGLSVAEIEYLKDSIIENCRVDGRNNQEFRSVRIARGVSPSSLGSARVTNSEVDVICSIQAEVVAPSLTGQDQGDILVNVDFAFPSQAESKLNACGGNTLDFSRRLGRQLLDGPLSEQVIPREELVIFPGRFVWLIYVDILFLSIGVLSADIASLALIAALRNTRLPNIRIVLEDQMELTTEFGDEMGDAIDISKLLLPSNQKVNENTGLFNPETLKLSKLLNFDVDGKLDKSKPFPRLEYIPVIVSIGLLDDKAVCDMSQDETFAVELVLSGAVCQNGDLFSLSKTGGRTLTYSQITTTSPVLKAMGQKIFAALFQTEDQGPQADNISLLMSYT